MATMTSSAAPSFTGLRAPRCSAKAKVSAAKVAGHIKASFKDMGVVVAATAASAVLVGNAMAVEDVLLGGDFNGERNAAAGFLQKVVLEGDAGVDVGKKSMPEEGYLNAGGGRYSMRLDESFDCATQQGADMEDAKQIQRKLLARLTKPW